MRTLRVLVLADRLGQVMKGEGDQAISLLGRALAHARATARYAIFYGEGRDIYDVRGRTAHEAIFNVDQWRLSLRCYATGIFRLFHLDPRPELGDVRLRRIA